MLRLFRTTFAACGRSPPSEKPQASSSAAMHPYRSGCNNNQYYYYYYYYWMYQMFRPFGSTANYMSSSSLRSYFPRAKWIFGSLLTLLVPSWKQSWEKFQTLEDEAEMVIEEAENVAEVVEKVAEITGKVSAEIAEKLPEKSKLKEAAEVVENYSKEIAHDAHLTQHILHKVEEWKQKLDKSETAVNEHVLKKKEA